MERRARVEQRKEKEKEIHANLILPAVAADIFFLCCYFAFVVSGGLKGGGSATSGTDCSVPSHVFLTLPLKPYQPSSVATTYIYT
jgi:hypothetical protein